MPKQILYIWTISKTYLKIILPFIRTGRAVAKNNLIKNNLPLIYKSKYSPLAIVKFLQEKNVERNNCCPIGRRQLLRRRESCRPSTEPERRLHRLLEHLLLLEHRVRRHRRGHFDLAIEDRFRLLPRHFCLW